MNPNPYPFAIRRREGSINGKVVERGKYSTAEEASAAADAANATLPNDLEDWNYWFAVEWSGYPRD